MPETSSRRYHAFVSYSHEDRKIGDRFFQDLDKYRVPRSLHGRDTSIGLIPRRLHPCFRDREELSTSSNLTDTIHAALSASDNLVVLCSPRSAVSSWVDQEIRRFQEIGKGNRIHPVIIDGKPAEALPPALRGANGAEPLAADIQETGDGWTNAKLKVIAGILGVTLGELKDRDAARQRARTRWFSSAAIAFLLLAIFASIAAWWANEESQRANAQLARAERAILVGLNGISGLIDLLAQGNRDGSITPMAANELLGTVEELTSDMTTLAPKNIKLMEQHARLLLTYSRFYRDVGEITAAQASAEEAREILAELPTTGAGEYESERLLSAALGEIGENHRFLQNYSRAIEYFEDSLSQTRRLIERYPNDSILQHGEATTLNRIGVIYQTLGETEAALELFEEVKQIHEQLLSDEPENITYMIDMAGNSENIGQHYLQNRNTESALQAYDRVLELRRRIISNSNTPENRFDLATILFRIGEAHLIGNNAETALQNLEESISLLRELFEVDNSNVRWASRYSTALNEAGRAYLMLDDTSSASTTFQSSLNIMEGLYNDESENPQIARPMTIALDGLGNVHLITERNGRALEFYERSEQIKRHFFEASDDVFWANSLATTLSRLGVINDITDNRRRAEEYFTEALDIYNDLLAINPDNALWRRNQTLIQEYVAR